MNKRYLFLITFGPVQSYIGQARKTKDLYAGSRQLSSLTLCAMKYIQELDNTAEIKFPYYIENDHNPSYPNRCIASVTYENIEEFGKKVEQKVLDKYVKTNKILLSNFRDMSSAIIQLEQQLDIYWVAIPYGENSYREQYNSLEQMMGKLKQIRTFNSLNDIESEKCTSCGERSSLIDFKMSESEGSYILKKNERLCAVCYAKRRFLDALEGTFPSNSEIALSFWLHELLKHEEGKYLYREFEKNFTSTHWSKEFLFIDNLNKNELEEVGEKEFNIPLAKKNLENIYEYMRDKKKTMNKYYALISFDGDDMGKWISGLKFKEEFNLEEIQNRLSQYLREFAQWLREYLVWNLDADKLISTQICKNEVQFGSVVYAGGDDFLGMIPLENLFLTLKKIREEFKVRVNDKLVEYMIEGEELTISAGICIAHYKTPLEKVLEEARKHENIAKKSRIEKNAASICVVKGSGEIIQATIPWTGDAGSIFNVLYSIQEKLVAGKFTSNFINIAQREICSLVQVESKIPKLQNIVLSEMSRLVARSYNDKFEYQDKTETRNIRKKEDINKLNSYLSEYMNSLVKADFTFKDFIGGLLIVDFVRRKISDN